MCSKSALQWLEQRFLDIRVSLVSVLVFPWFQGVPSTLTQIFLRL